MPDLKECLFDSLGIWPGKSAIVFSGNDAFVIDTDQAGGTFIGGLFSLVLRNRWQLAKQGEHEKE